MAKARLPTPELLRQLLDYDPETGVLTWRERPVSMFGAGSHGQESEAKRWNRKNAGKQVGSPSQGYLRCGIGGIFILTHRIVWAITYGAWPDGEIDHINHDRSDNRLVNLRLVTKTENNRNQRKQKNNTSGVTGVIWDKRAQMWRARIYRDGQWRHLGLFKDFEDASLARRAAETELGYHVNHGQDLGQVDP